MENFLEKNLEKQNRIKFFNISKNQGAILQNFVELKNPKNILEIGTSNGISTIFLAKNLKENSLITTIEIDKKVYEIAKKNFEILNLKNIKQILGDVFEVLKSTEKHFKENEIFDLVFLDACQKDYKILVEEFFKKKLVNEKTFFICDNVDTHNLLDFIKYVKQNFGFVINDNSLNGFFYFCKS